VFVNDRATGAIERVSVDGGGRQHRGVRLDPARIERPPPGLGTRRADAGQSDAVSTGGVHDRGPGPSIPSRPSRRTSRRAGRRCGPRIARRCSTTSPRATGASESGPAR
jgi:hypothetical protein